MFTKLFELFSGGKSNKPQESEGNKNSPSSLFTDNLFFNLTADFSSFSYFDKIKFIKIYIARVFNPIDGANRMTLGGEKDRLRAIDKNALVHGESFLSKNENLLNELRNPSNKIYLILSKQDKEHLLNALEKINFKYYYQEPVFFNQWLNIIGILSRYRSNSDIGNILGNFDMKLSNSPIAALIWSNFHNLFYQELLTAIEVCLKVWSLEDVEDIYMQKNNKSNPRYLFYAMKKNGISEILDEFPARYWGIHSEKLPFQNFVSTNWDKWMLLDFLVLFENYVIQKINLNSSMTQVEIIDNFILFLQQNSEYDDDSLKSLKTVSMAWAGTGFNYSRGQESWGVFAESAFSFENLRLILLVFTELELPFCESYSNLEKGEIILPLYCDNFQSRNYVYHLLSTFLEVKIEEVYQKIDIIYSPASNSYFSNFDFQTKTQSFDDPLTI